MKVVVTVIEVEYGKTVNRGDYNSEKATCTLTATVDDMDDSTEPDAGSIDEAIDLLQMQAREAVNRQLAGLNTEQFNHASDIGMLERPGKSEAQLAFDAAQAEQPSPMPPLVPPQKPVERVTPADVCTPAQVRFTYSLASAQRGWDEAETDETATKRYNAAFGVPSLSKRQASAYIDWLKGQDGRND